MKNPRVDSDGRTYISLSKSGKKKTHRVHRLVIAAFVGPAPDGMICCHNDGDATNNMLSNLRWDTPSENMYDRRRHGTDHYANRSHCKNAHEFTSENTVIRRGARICLTCQKSRMSHNIIPIWTKQDAVDTANEFNNWLSEAERGTSVTSAKVRSKSRWTAKLFGRSRFRRAKVYDGLAVALLMALMAALGTVVYAASAKADPDSDAAAYAAEYGPAVCSVLDDYPSVSGMLGIMQAITEQGMTEYQAGEVVGIAIYRLCPEYGYLAEKFMRRYGGTTAAA